MLKINIALSFDDNYAIGGGVVIHSTLKNLKENIHATIHILYSELNTDSKTRIERIVRQHDSLLRWHCIDQKTFESFNTHKIPRHYTKEALFRLLLPDLLPRIDEILYLDVDLLVRDDVSVLFQKHASSLVGACLDMFMPRAKQQVPNFEHYGLSANDLVVNTGVCLFNLKEIRKTALIARSVQLLIEHTEDMRYLDQTAINIAFKGKINFLPMNWNVFPGAIAKQWISPVDSIRPFDCDVLTNPKIVHFTARPKPWTKSPKSISFSDEWRKSLYESRWFHSEIELFIWVLKRRWNRKTLQILWKWRSI